jgi:hypothetical protein
MTESECKMPIRDSFYFTSKFITKYFLKFNIGVFDKGNAGNYLIFACGVSSERQAENQNKKSKGQEHDRV